MMNIPWHEVDLILWWSGVNMGIAIGMVLSAVIWLLCKRRRK